MIPDPSTLAIFVGASLVFLLTPGPAVLYIVTRSIEQGRLAGIASTLGIGVGTVMHVAAAALGVSAILVSSATAFSVVKYAGAAYLIYLGLRTLLAREEDLRGRRPGDRKLTRAFLQGVLVNLLNPKQAVFFFAFLPQFIDVGRGTAAGQILFLGATFVALGFLSDGSYAMLAGSAGGWLKRNLGLVRAQRYFAGGLFIALGLTSAFSSSGRSN